MATKPPSAAVRDGARGGVQPEETALRRFDGDGVTYITPTPADVDVNYWLWRRTGATELSRRPATTQEVVEIAADDRTERVTVWASPAWPVVFR